MAPEILNYVADVDPENLKYTNAVDMWALGCIVYRLACGVVPFLPGLSLVRFCENESAFPLGPIPFSDYAKKFVKDLVVSSPAQRLTAQEALDHPWTKVGTSF
jgi:serine/threonine protein kinase